VERVRPHIHQPVVRYVDNHTVQKFCVVVISGMSDFLRAQFESGLIDLDALRERIVIDLQLKPARKKRGVYLAIGKPNNLV
jgi:hypothetical protein